LQFFFLKKAKKQQGTPQQRPCANVLFLALPVRSAEFLKKNSQTKKSSHTPKTRHAQMRLVW